MAGRIFLEKCEADDDLVESLTDPSRACTYHLTAFEARGRDEEGLQNELQRCLGSLPLAANRPSTLETPVPRSSSRPGRTTGLELSALSLSLTHTLTEPSSFSSSSLRSPKSASSQVSSAQQGQQGMDVRKNRSYCSMDTYEYNEDPLSILGERQTEREPE